MEQYERLMDKIRAAQKACANDGLIASAMVRLRRLKAEHHRRELDQMDATLKDFVPVLETTIGSAHGGEDFEKLLNRVEDLEGIVARNPSRQVEVSELGVAVRRLQV